MKINSNYQKLTNRSLGFTLIEVLVIAPVIILFIGAFIGLIVGLTGDSLQTRANNEVSYQVQDALDDIEAANGRSIDGYPATTGTLTSPQGVNNSTTAFSVTNNDTSATDNDVLIIKTPATTHDPINPDRSIIRYNTPNACNSSNVSSNAYYPVTLVFFVSSGTLWQRTILPSSGAACIEPWQKPSCAESQTLTGVCKTYDDKLAENVSSFSVKYYTAAGVAVSSSDPSTAKSVEISIKSDKTVAGKSITYTGKVRSTVGDINATPAPPTRQSIATGVYYACAIKSGQAYCWGMNNYGQLGNNGGTSGSYVPVAVYTGGVLSGKTVTSIDAQQEHTCAVANGQAYCWGRNQYGQLGNGTTTNSAVPVAVSTSGVLNGKTVTDVSVGAEHSCAIADGGLYCWGSSIYGKFGNGAASSDSYTPVAVATGNTLLSGKTISQSRLGSLHTCAVAEQKAYCWGGNYNGQLGINQTGNSQNVPYAVYTGGVLGTKNVSYIDTGTGNHMCAVADGSAYCWGNNGDSGSGTNGQLGDGTSTGSYVPVAVVMSGAMSGKTVTNISASSNNSCAVASGKAFCWGYNGYGQVGDNTTTNQYSPAAVNDTGVLAGKIVTEISVGAAYFTCATASGSFYCWGYNGYGNLGNGSTSNSAVPVAVSQGAMP